MGAWSYVRERLQTAVNGSKRIRWENYWTIFMLDWFRLSRYVGRTPCASVATGSKASHTHEEESILTEAFEDII